MTETANQQPYANLVPVEPNRAIITAEATALWQIEEYMNGSERVISLPVDSLQAKLHSELLSEDLPVLPIVRHNGVDQRIELIVPGEAWPVRKLLKFISRDVEQYSTLFFQIGEQMHLLRSAGHKLPAPAQNQALLDGFMYVQDDSSETGSAVYMTPPYTFHSTDFPSALSLLKRELTASGELSKDVIGVLLAQLRNGWNNDRAEH